MRTLEDAKAQFAYHPATPETAPKHAEIRDQTAIFVEKVWPVIPDGPEKTLALRALQEFQMYANLAIALTAPVDTKHQATARVLPSDV